MSACCAGHTEQLMKSDCYSVLMNTLWALPFCGLGVPALRPPLCVSVSKVPSWIRNHGTLFHLSFIFAWVSSSSLQLTSQSSEVSLNVFTAKLPVFLHTTVNTRTCSCNSLLYYRSILKYFSTCFS